MENMYIVYQALYCYKHNQNMLIVVLLAGKENYGFFKIRQHLIIYSSNNFGFRLFFFYFYFI